MRRLAPLPSAAPSAARKRRIGVHTLSATLGLKARGCTYAAWWLAPLLLHLSFAGCNAETASRAPALPPTAADERPPASDTLPVTGDEPIPAPPTRRPPDTAEAPDADPDDVDTGNDETFQDSPGRYILAWPSTEGSPYCPEGETLQSGSAFACDEDNPCAADEMCAPGGCDGKGICLKRGAACLSDNDCADNAPCLDARDCRPGEPCPPLTPEEPNPEDDPTGGDPEDNENNEDGDAPPEHDPNSEHPGQGQGQGNGSGSGSEPEDPGADDAPEAEDAEPAEPPGPGDQEETPETEAESEAEASAPLVAYCRPSLPGCSDSRSCAPGFRCETEAGGMRVCVDRRLPCVAGSRCPAGHRCQYTHRAAVALCVPTAVTCSVATGTPCFEDELCASLTSFGDLGTCLPQRGECSDHGACLDADAPRCGIDPFNGETRCMRAGPCLENTDCAPGDQCIDLAERGVGICHPSAGCQADAACPANSLCGPSAGSDDVASCLCFADGPLENVGCESGAAD